MGKYSYQHQPGNTGHGESGRSDRGAPTRRDALMLNAAIFGAIAAGAGQAAPATQALPNFGVLYGCPWFVGQGAGNNRMRAHGQDHGESFFF
jgi:hypothetical protein